MATNNGAITNWYSCFLFLIFFFVFLFGLSHALDSISLNAILRDNETLVSTGGVFELGFFSDPFTGNRYMGIWFKDDPRKRPVWVANRDNPLINSTCFLQIRYDGNLILIDRRLVPVIVNSGALSTSPNTTATLLDTGNFVLQVGAKMVWQSFDYPTDTYLPGMKIGWFGLTSDLPTIQVLSSWASPSNPSHGDFTLGVDYMVANLSVYRGDSAHVNIGYCDGTRIRLLFANSSNSFNFSYFSNPNESYFTFTTIENYSMSWLVMASTGLIDEYTLSDSGISMMSHSLCEELGNYTVNGSFCLPSTPSTCNATFSAISGSLSTSSIANGSIVMGFSNCESICSSNCSCVAYTAPATDQSGCQMYFGNEDDLSNIIQKRGGLVYVRGDILPRKHSSKY
ncbi:S-locus-specific glycoprotein S13-like [Rhododendron vialii]|uniref:S-locus-specific glycoprotein S13-like n=1 Tax=Rhododendron vialii TaxID=182163 RepID=UPI00265E35A6|nr:S-locus-specific glycoprotein S13-like [Rhododendron vialii]